MGGSAAQLDVLGDNILRGGHSEAAAGRSRQVPGCRQDVEGEASRDLSKNNKNRKRSKQPPKSIKKLNNRRILVKIGNQKGTPAGQATFQESLPRTFPYRHPL